MRHLRPSILLVPLLLAASCQPPPVRDFFRDGDNRIVLYRGVCVANTAKTAPDFLPWQKKEDFARLREWGFNIVRYQVFWAAIEPEEGRFNDEYLAATAERLLWLRELGIDVFLDVHQDLYAAKFSGNGFPEWAVHDLGLPFHRRSPWNANYLEPAVIASYTYFWNSDALQEKYIRMLARLLNRFGEFSNVIGVDVINEPFPALNLSFERNQLSRFYEKVQAMWTETKARPRLFFEPMMFNSAGVPTMLSFRPGPACVFAPHYYDPLCHEGAPYTMLNKAWLNLVFRCRVKDAHEFRNPLLIGEFGIGANVRNYLDYLDDFTNLADRYYAGWTYYSFDKTSEEAFGILDQNGAETERMQRLVRLYPQRIAGENPRMTSLAKSFELSYDIASTNAPTVIFIPRRFKNVRILVNGLPQDFSGDSLYLEIPAKKEPGNRQTVNITWQ